MAATCSLWQPRREKRHLAMMRAQQASSNRLEHIEASLTQLSALVEALREAQTGQASSVLPSSASDTHDCVALDAIHSLRTRMDRMELLLFRTSPLQIWIGNKISSSRQSPARFGTVSHQCPDLRRWILFDISDPVADDIDEQHGTSTLYGKVGSSFLCILAYTTFCTS